MPKRKRGENDPVKLRKAEVEQKIDQCKKELNKALKLAKHSEILKLGRRQKQATESADETNLKRINREIAVLKTLDFGQATDAHLHKTLLKSKSIAESPLLPDIVREIRRPGGDEEQILAFNNVTARLYNAKAVKTTMAQIMTKMYITLEIPEPSNRGKAKKPKVDAKGSGKEQKISNVTAADSDIEEPLEAVPEVEEDIEWEGFSSESGAGEDGEDIEEQDSENEDGDDFSFDEEELARYDARLGNSSDESDPDDSNTVRESSFPPQSIPTTQSSKPTRSLSISRSPSPPQRKIKSILKPSQPKPELDISRGSVFTTLKDSVLPELMVNYWSGEESEASDIEDHVAPPRKNRRGQQARRKIAELKFGARAKHLAAENAAAGKSRNNGRDDRAKDWDMKRGAVGDDDRNPRNRKERRMNGARGRDNRQITGENAVPLGGRNPAEVEKSKDDGKKGVNHPSWLAAKKAKEAVKTASFQGTKVKFS